MIIRWVIRARTSRFLADALLAAKVEAVKGVVNSICVALAGVFEISGSVCSGGSVS